MSIKKKISDIDKAIEEMQQRRDECFKQTNVLVEK